MCINLPCGYSRQTLTKIIAYFEIIVIVPIILLEIFLLFVVIGEDDTNEADEDNRKTEIQKIIAALEWPSSILICLILWALVNLFASLAFSFLLLRGAEQRNLEKVRLWFFFTIVISILWIPILLFSIMSSSNRVGAVAIISLCYMIEASSLSVVFSFMQELRIEHIVHRPGFRKHSIPFSHIV